MNIYGFHKHAKNFGHLAQYGSDAPEIQAIHRAVPESDKAIHPDLSITPAQVIWAVREEMARSVEDVLSRRTRCLLLNARVSIDIVNTVAFIMAEELNEDDAWINHQCVAFTELANGYVLNE